MEVALGVTAIPSGCASATRRGEFSLGDMDDENGDWSEADGFGEGPFTLSGCSGFS